MAASMSSTGQCRRGLSLLLALSFSITLSPASPAAGEPGALSAIADGLSAWVVAIKVDRSKDIEIPRSRLPFNGRVSPESQGYFKRPKGSVTGLLVDRRGYILTSNYNLLGTISSITVRLPSGEERKARVVARGQLDDLALIKVEGDADLVEKKSWRDPPWAETSPSAAGSFVFAIGRGSAPGRLNLTEGIISAVGRNSNRAVQTDAKLNYGNVGGPLVDLDGKVVGLSGFVGHIYNQWGLNSGIGFATTVETIRRVLPDLLKGKDFEAAPRPFLGIVSKPASEGNDGAPVVEVVPNSSAASAGVKSKDLIIRFNGKDVPTFNRLRILISSCKVGDKVEFVVRRGGKKLILNGVLGKFPERR